MSQRWQNCNKIYKSVFEKITSKFSRCQNTTKTKLLLALINRAGTLYGRTLTKVCTHDRGQNSSIQTDLARLIRCLLYGKNKNNLICLINWFVVTDILLANGDESNLILPKFARPLYFFSSSTFWH